MTQPTVYIVIGRSACAFEEISREAIETVEWNADGTPDWTNVAVCDARGSGGVEGYEALVSALMRAEKNARLCGYEIKRVPLP